MIPAQVQQTPQTPTPFHSASLYVGDLAPDVSEGLLFEIFNAVGPVASIRVCRDTVTRRSLGYAYVNFHNVADAERALDTMNFTLIKNQPCRIMWSQRDPALRRSAVGNIFVKNLSSQVDHKALYDTFSLFGNIMSCKLITDPEGKSKGYGYVHYETAESANDAIAKINGMLIAGEKVYVGHFVRRLERANQAEWTNVYVKNIPTDWNDTKLGEIFVEFGEVTSATVSKKPSPEDENEEADKLVPMGFGFVNFAEHEAAATAVQHLNGRKFPDADGVEKEIYVGRAQKKSERERELRQKFDQLKLERMNKYQGVNLYIKNLDETVTDDQLRTEFAPFGTITSAKLMRDAQGNSRGFGFVCYSAPEEATKAVTEMNGKLLINKPIYCALAQRKEVRRAQLEAQFQRASGGVVPRLPLGQPNIYSAMPMYMPQPGAPGAAGIPARGYPMMPTMMPRGQPRGPIPQYAGRGNYPMPLYATPYAAMGLQQQQAQAQLQQAQVAQAQLQAQQLQAQQAQAMSLGQQQRGRGRGRGSGGVQGGRGAGLARGGIPQSGRQGVIAIPVPQASVMPPPTTQEPLTPAALAAATPEQQKNMIGERLYPLIAQTQPELCGKITGMLLEMDNGELLHLLESPDALATKISEALTVLEQHNATLAAQQASQEM
jgi:polyadenylate-binding protein